MTVQFTRHIFLFPLPWKRLCTAFLHQFKPAVEIQEKDDHDIIRSAVKSSNMHVTNGNPLHFSSMPGPGGFRKLPYLGTVFMFKPFSEFSPETFGRMINSMHEKYGCVFKSRLGKDYSVHTDNVEDIETIFRTESAYPLRRLMTLSKVFRERNNLCNALGTVSGPEWQELRSPLNPLLNRPQVCLHYLPAQNLVAEDFVRRLQTNTFSPDQLSLEFFKFAAESIGVVCFNQRLGFLQNDLQCSPEKKRLLEAFRTVLHCTFISMIGIERRYLKDAQDPFYLKFEDEMRFIRKQSMIYVDKVIKELNARRKQEDHSLQTEILKTETNLLASMIVNSKIDTEQILAIIDSMLIAGTDSTARNIAILFYNLAVNPQVQNKAAKEIIDLIGPQGPVTPESLAKMNYIKACVKESMRINFPLSNGTERILTSDTVLSGYLVPKGTSVIMSSSRSSLNPKHFEDPLKFFPERWIRKDVGEKEDRTINKRTSAFAYLPFGHGARGCIGRRFAEMEIYVAIAKLLQSLEIHVDPSYPGLDPIYTPFITPKDPIPFIFKKRLQ